MCSLFQEKNIGMLRVGVKANLAVEDLAQHIVCILDQLILDSQ